MTSEINSEAEWIAALRPLARHAAARGLRDDVAILDIDDILSDLPCDETSDRNGANHDKTHGANRGALIVTQDMLAEHSHWLASADASDVAWKLLAVNLSDLAAKGAEPLGVLLGYVLSDSAWNRGFVEGLAAALAHFEVPLLGGDTIALQPPHSTAPPRTASIESPRLVTMTALGYARYPVPARSGAQIGDALWVTGTIGDAGAGLALAERNITEPAALLAAYHRPQPHLAEGQALARHVRAMLDISDGLLIDAHRLATASGVALDIELADIPLSADFVAVRGADEQARCFAASAGDDYQLLFALPQGESPPIEAHKIGQCRAGEGIRLFYRGAPRELPKRLGYQHWV